MKHSQPQYDFLSPEMRELLYGENGPLDTSPPVLPMLKKWTGSPPFHLNVEPGASPQTTRRIDVKPRRM